MAFCKCAQSFSLDHIEAQRNSLQAVEVTRSVRSSSWCFLSSPSTSVPKDDLKRLITQTDDTSMQSCVGLRERIRVLSHKHTPQHRYVVLLVQPFTCATPRAWRNARLRNFHTAPLKEHPRSRNDHIRRGKKIVDDVIKLFSVLLSLMLSVSSFVVSLQHNNNNNNNNKCIPHLQRTPALTIEILQITTSKNVSKSVEHVTVIIATTDIETQDPSRIETTMRTMLEVCSFQSLGACKSASVLVKRTPLCVSFLHNMQFVQERNCAHGKPMKRKQDNNSSIQRNDTYCCRHPAKSENDATPSLNTRHRKCTDTCTLPPQSTPRHSRQAPKGARAQHNNESSPPSRRELGRGMLGFDHEEEKALSPTTTLEIE